MKTRFTIMFILGAILVFEANQPATAASSQPVISQSKQTRITPAGWTYQPDLAPGYYYYEPVIPEYYYYEPAVPVAPYYYVPEPNFVQPGFSLSINL